MAQRLRQALFDAIADEDFDGIADLVEQDEDVLELKDGEGLTGWLYACQEGCRDVVEWLWEEDCGSLRARTKWRLTPLHLAAQNGHTEVVRYLLERAYEDLTEKPGTLLAAVDVDGDPAIILASYEGHLEVVKQLVIFGGQDVNTTNRRNFSALTAAAESGHLKLVQWLLTRAVAKEKTGFMDVERVQGMTPLCYAARMGYANVIHAMASEKCDVEGRSLESQVMGHGGMTPLLLAATAGHVDAIRALVIQGADVEATSWAGHTLAGFAKDSEAEAFVRHVPLLPLAVAVEGRQPHALAALLHRGADPRSLDFQGATCFPDSLRTPTSKLRWLANNTLSYPGALPACAETRRVLHAGLGGWRPASHHLHPKRLRAKIRFLHFVLVLVKQQREGELPDLPVEMWWQAFHFLDRADRLP